MLTTAERTKRKKLKNTTEKTERENNFNEITENMFPTPLNMKDSRGKMHSLTVPSKKAEILTSLAGKFNLCTAAPRNKSG